MKLIFILTLLLLNNCSLNKDSRYWTEDHLSFKEKIAKKKSDKMKLPKILEKSGDIRTMTIEEYEIYINDYTKKSKYPDINQ